MSRGHGSLADTVKQVLFEFYMKSVLIKECGHLVNKWIAYTLNCHTS